MLFQASEGWGQDPVDRDCSLPVAFAWLLVRAQYRISAGVLETVGVRDAGQ